VGAKFAVCNSKLYLFGGEFEDSNGNIVPNSNVYRLEVDVEERIVEFVEMACRGRVPCSRTAHSMTGVSDYLMVVGGQSIQENRMLRDIWLFDIDGAEWVKIDPANGPIRPLADNTLLLHGSSLLVLGGLTEHDNMWNEQILAIEFGESEPYRSEICSNCLQRSAVREKEEKAFPKTVVLSSGFFYTVSL
jgi:N-acetylneuraminic acid mutarotase